MIGWWLWFVAGCGPSIDCGAPGAVLAEAEGASLTCEEGEVVVDYIELLAGRPVPRQDTLLALGAVAERFQAAPEETRAWLASVREAGVALAGTGLQAAARRSERVWAAERGEDLVKKSDGDLWNVQSRALSVWAKDDREHLAMTESDLEAWIRYASLCREVQGAGVLRISVADRVTVYRDLIARFDEGDRDTKIALGSMGAVWRQVTERWQQASYDEQRSWIDAAPLPPPMTATSLGYAEAIFSSDVASHARALHEALGPFRMTAPGAFSSTSP